MGGQRDGRMGGRRNGSRYGRMGEGLGMDVRGRVKTEGFIKPLALRDGCKGGVKV